MTKGKGDYNQQRMREVRHGRYTSCSYRTQTSKTIVARPQPVRQTALGLEGKAL